MTDRYCHCCGDHRSPRAIKPFCKDCRIRLRLSEKQRSLFLQIKAGTYENHYRRLQQPSKGFMGSKRRAHNQAIISLQDRGLITFDQDAKTWKLTRDGETAWLHR